jgi:hypothetical protein
MNIDDRVEPLVRDTLYAAVRQDFDQLETALQAFPDDQSSRKGAELALAIGAVTLLDVYGRKPTPTEIRAVGDKLCQMETWAEPTPDEVNTFLTKLVDGESLEGALPAESVVILAFVVAANLLSSCHKEGEEWWDYLDRIEAGLEATK